MSKVSPSEGPAEMASFAARQEGSQKAKKTLLSQNKARCKRTRVGIDNAEVRRTGVLHGLPGWQIQRVNAHAIARAKLYIWHQSRIELP